MRKFFRNVRNDYPGPEDFRSLGDEGVDCSRTRYPRECAEGVSVWDEVEIAIAKARETKFKRGSFVATLLVPEDGTIEFAMTIKPHHATIYYGSPESILALMDGPATCIPEAP